MSFWEFSLQTYAKQGVQPACLRLQDQCGLDVNVLLFCAWAAHKSLQASKQQFSELLDLAEDWRNQTVDPLRSARRNLKRFSHSSMSPDEVHTLREKTKTLELAAEKLQQQAMESLSTSWQSPSNGTAHDSFDNYIDQYLKHLAFKLSNKQRTDLNTIRQAALE